MSGEKRDFDRDAAAWEDNPARVRMAERIVDAVTGLIVLTSEMNVMDFGCGTGLISRRILPFVAAVTGVDSSPGMLQVFRKKAFEGGLGGIGCRLADIDKGDELPCGFDLVISGMTLHHIRDTGRLFAKLYAAIVAGGYLCVADLDPDDGEFHDDPAGVFHHGFEREEIRRYFTGAGFDIVGQTTAADITRPSHSGAVRTFTVSLTAGRKPA
jgi:SAM-dependent methyltransferase